MKRSMLLAVAGAAVLTAAVRVDLAAPTAAPMEIVARAGTQELSAERLALMLATGKLEGSTESAALIARFWVDYHLAGMAAARGDSLIDPRVVDDAMWATIDQELFQKYIDATMKGSVDTTGLEARYVRGEYLAAQHILIKFPDGARGKTPAAQESVRRKADSIRRLVTATNFSKLAEQFSEEPGGRENTGRTGVTGPGTWVPEFEAAVRALKPGDVSPAAVKTQYGYHVIRRQTLAEVRDEYISHLRVYDTDAEMVRILSRLAREYQLTASPPLAAMTRRIVVDPDAWVNDKTVLGTSLEGDFTAGRLARSILAYPQLAGNNLRVRLATAQDSVVVRIVRDSIAGKHLLVAAARKANITLSATQLSSIRGMFRTFVVSANRELRIDGKSLEGASTVADRERVAAQRAEQALERVVSTGGGEFVEVRVPLETALRSTYPWAVNHDAYARVVSRASAIRAALDSTRAQKQPSTGRRGG